MTAAALPAPVAAWSEGEARSRNNDIRNDDWISFLCITLLKRAKPPSTRTGMMKDAGALN